MKRAYERWRKARDKLGTLNELAAKHGMSKSLFMYYVNKEPS